MSVFAVALHPEGVDRNYEDFANWVEAQEVALHPEGVDRNKNTKEALHEVNMSPSTRRAWIEMSSP